MRDAGGYAGIFRLYADRSYFSFYAVAEILIVQ
jgi:hypothetical protein